VEGGRAVNSALWRLIAVRDLAYCGNGARCSSVPKFFSRHGQQAQLIPEMPNDYD
jgi:hypothetical protein